MTTRTTKLTRPRGRHTAWTGSTVARRRSVAVAVAVTLLGVLGTATLGSAAGLAIAPGSISSSTLSHPCPGTLAATTPSTSVPVSTVTVTAPATCAGRQLQVAVTSGGVTVQGTATAPASGSVTVTLSGTYTPSTTTTVAATVSGWNLPTTWTYTPVTYPVCQVYRIVGGVETLRPGTCTVSGLKVDNSWGTAGSRIANVSISFTYSGATYPDYFRFTVDMATTTGLPAGWNWATSGTKGGNLVLSPTYRCASLPILAGGSDPGWGPTGGFQFQIVEDRASQTVTCAP